jgi:ribonuclease Z
LGGQTLLVDCGDGLSSAFSRSGVDYDSVDRVFLSHLHSDHVGGFLMFIQGMWLERRRRPLVVHMPGEGIEPLRRMLDAVYLFEELVGFRLELKPLEAGKAVRVGAVKVVPNPTSHLDDLKNSFGKKYRQGFECFSFSMEGAGKRVGHSADIGSLSDLEPLVAKPLDHLVCELAHCELDSICEMLVGKKIGRITFIHLARPLWENLSGTRRKLRARLGGIPFEIGREGQELAIGAGKSAGAVRP